ncbi:MAG: diguanylate cyclase [Pyrinomonadaceae bacterium]|nr:diguanylate cyclase [Pyrinomonadaceae bacterium]
MTTNNQTKDANWSEMQNNLANQSGVSVVTIDENSSVLLQSNDNSICQVLYNSKEFASSCAQYCGKAYSMATEAQRTVNYKCYAGLNCLAVPIKKQDKSVVAIVGRTFLKSQDYREATQRALDGDWKDFPRTKFFENVILSGSQASLEVVAGKLENLSERELEMLFRFLEKKRSLKASVAEPVETSPAAKPQSESERSGERLESQTDTKHSRGRAATALIEEFHRSAEKNDQAADDKFNDEESVVWRSLFGSLLDLSYKEACTAILQFLQRRYSISSLAWLERYENQLETILAGGKLKETPLRFKFAADDKRLIEVSKKGLPLELKVRVGKEEDPVPNLIQLYPIGVGSSITNALVVGDNIRDENTKRHISRFCQRIASDIEILHLREQLSHREWLERAVQVFNESVKHIDSEDFWTSLAQILSELLKSERSSLLIFDEKSDTFSVKAATGVRADFLKTERKNIGERISKNVLKKGKPYIRRDMRQNDVNAAPPDWKYKSSSFISYPIRIAGREIGVLNVTDKTDGEIFDQVDLELLDVIVPHLAVLIDRALLKQKAGEYEHLSVTDALTGLLNRRYLEERLTEELQRSNRHGYPMSFMMIDVDNFKSYNDNFSHLDGDTALRKVGQCLKEILRGADVAARYGGEEFSILLPQTNSFEAEAIGERIREKVALTRFPHRQVTVSIGIVSCSSSVNSAQDLIWAADTALYEAKRRGKNNVQVYENLNIEEISQERNLEKKYN